jgi:hypothetical protein
MLSSLAIKIESSRQFMLLYGSVGFRIFYFKEYFLIIFISVFSSKIMLNITKQPHI